MSLLDVLRHEYLVGVVLDKYLLDSGDVGLVLEGRAGQRYHVAFRDGYGASLENLFGLLKEPFEGRTEQVEKLIGRGDVVELTVNYNKTPLRQAYRIHSVTGTQYH